MTRRIPANTAAMNDHNACHSSAVGQPAIRHHSVMNVSLWLAGARRFVMFPFAAFSMAQFNHCVNSATALGGPFGNAKAGPSTQPWQQNGNTSRKTWRFEAIHDDPKTLKSRGSCRRLAPIPKSLSPSGGRDGSSNLPEALYKWPVEAGSFPELVAARPWKFSP